MESPSQRNWLVVAPLACMVLAVLMVIVVRVRLLDVPFERDEGEYAYMGQLMLQGVPPYGTAANMKLPGTHAAYALIMAIFGQTITGIHLGFLLVNAGCIILLFFVAKRLFEFKGAVAAAASYAVLTIGPGVDGVWAHATHFVVLFALAAILLLLKWTDRQQSATLIASGALFGMAFLMKQPGILFAIFGGLFVIYTVPRRAVRNGFLFGAAFILPFAITCLLLWRAGVFAKFWFWIFTYAASYVSITSLGMGANYFLQHAIPILTWNLGLCFLTAWGFIQLWQKHVDRKRAFFVTGLLICSAIAVCPGFYFRPHYFVLVMPAIAILAAAVVSCAKSPVLPLWAVVAALGYSVVTQSEYLFQMSPTEVVRSVYGIDPFAEAIPVSAYIRAHTNDNDRVLVFGSEPEIFFYSGRRAATPYLYVYPLVEPQPLTARMQQEFIDEIEAWKPKYLVFVQVAESWSLLPDAPKGLVVWALDYYKQHYDNVGAVEISPEQTIYKWDADAVNYRFKESTFLIVGKRKGS